MPIYLGNQTIDNEFYGNGQLGNIFLGNQLIQSSPNNIVAEGGTISYSGSYVIHTFTSSGEFKIHQGNPTVELLVVAGGGGGGGTVFNYPSRGGGGGAGGLFYTSSYNINKGTYSITIGAGGAKAVKPVPQYYATSSNGGNSSFGTIVALGGGGTGQSIVDMTGVNGGSGGGANGEECVGNSNICDYFNGGIALQPTSSAGGFGNNGGASTNCITPCSSPYGARAITTFGGGGGGAGSAGSGTTGGSGRTYNFTGTPVTYAAGGNAVGSASSGSAAPANSGNGGDAYYDGASGIVIVKYAQYV